MSNGILILGDSGMGKTASLRNLDPNTTLIIQPIKKKLPFKSNDWGNSTKSIIQTSDYNQIHKALDASGQWGKSAVIIDDANYLLTLAELARSGETGYQKFTDMAKSFYYLIEHLHSLPTEQRCYMMMHTELQPDGAIKPKLTGKMLSEKIVIEGLFSMVMRAQNQDNNFGFTTTNQNDCVKCPMGMFSEQIIDNDLAIVDNTIRQYYNLEY